MTKRGKKSNAQVKRKLRRQLRRANEEARAHRNPSSDVAHFLDQLAEDAIRERRQRPEHFNPYRPYYPQDFTGFLALVAGKLAEWAGKRLAAQELREQRCLLSDHPKCLADPDFGRACWDIRMSQSDAPVPTIDDPPPEPVPESIHYPGVGTLSHVLAAVWDEATSSYRYADPTAPDVIDAAFEAP